MLTNSKQYVPIFQISYILNHNPNTKIPIQVEYTKQVLQMQPCHLDQNYMLISPNGINHFIDFFLFFISTFQQTLYMTHITKLYLTSNIPRPMNSSSTSTRLQIQTHLQCTNQKDTHLVLRKL